MRGMLALRPIQPFSWDCELRDGETVVATLEIPYWGERGTLKAGDKTWQLGREDWFHGRYFLRGPGRTLATAEKPSAFLRSFRVRLGERSYDWEARSPFFRAFDLLESGKVVGSLKPEAPITRDAVVALPEELPIEERAFLAWLALLMWRRQRRRS